MAKGDEGLALNGGLAGQDRSDVHVEGNRVRASGMMGDIVELVVGPYCSGMQGNFAGGGIHPEAGGARAAAEGTRGGGGQQRDGRPWVGVAEAEYACAVGHAGFVACEADGVGGGVKECVEGKDGSLDDLQTEAGVAQVGRRECEYQTVVGAAHLRDDTLRPYPLAREENLGGVPEFAACGPLEVLAVNGDGAAFAEGGVGVDLVCWRQAGVVVVLDDGDGTVLRRCQGGRFEQQKEQ